MFNYISPLERVESSLTITFEASAHDMQSLLFAFLDEALFQFNADFFVCREIIIDSIETESFSIKATGRGELFDGSKHEHGTEIKAITYSNMQIHSPNAEKPLAE